MSARNGSPDASRASRARRDPFGLLRRVFQFRSMRPDLDAEVDAEIDYHLSRTRSELQARGASPEQARAEAERRFGNLDAHRQRILHLHRQRGRADRMSARFDAVRESLRSAVRALRSSPAVTATVVVTFALGIGANATMFGIVDRLLLRPPDHVANADTLVRVFVERAFIDRRLTTSSLPYADIMDWTAADAFADVAAYGPGWRDGNVTVGHGEGSYKIHGQHAAPNFFTLLGVTPLHGRFYAAEEDVDGAADYVVLGHDFWQSNYGGDLDVIGDSIVLDGAPHEILGVAPPGFTGAELGRVDAFMPLHSSAGGNPPAEVWETHRGYYWLQAVARLAPGVTVEAAAAEATSLHRAGREDDERYDQEAVVRLGSIIAARGVSPSSESQVARWLAAVAAIVLLIACANVANLLLARGARRRNEIGVRLALGVSGRRLFGQLLTESLLLALLGGAAALAVAHWGSQLVRAVLLPNVYWSSAALNIRVVGFTVAAALVTGLVAGIVPALNAMRQDIVAVLGGGSTRGAGDSGGRFRVVMLVLQTTLSAVLLVGAGLFVKSLTQVRAIDMGFEPAGLLVALPEIDSEELPDDQRMEFYSQAAERLRGLSVVEGVSVAQSVPFYSSMSAALVVPDVPKPPVFSSGGPYTLIVDHDYLATMGIRVLRGRGFTAADVVGAPRVTVLEDTMANAYWPGGDALGKCLKVGGEEAPCSTVVGIVESSARQELARKEEAQYYVPIAQSGRPRPEALFVRTDPARASEVALVVRNELEALHDGVRHGTVQPLQHLMDPQARAWELGATMFTAFGALALVIAAVGLYGAMSFNVARRLHEIGVRAALGAAPARLVWLVVRSGLVVAVVGLALGITGAVFSGRIFEPLLYEVTPTDPGVIGTVVAVLLAVAVAASAIPALRAARVDPVRSLRSD